MMEKMQEECCEWSKNQQKIWEANSMTSLLIVSTQVTLRGNVGSVNTSKAAQLFTFGRTVGEGIALRGL